MKDIAGQIKRKNIPFHGEKEAFSSFVNRVTGGKYTDKVRFSLIESASGFDEYVLTVTDGIIDIKATSGTAGGAALNAYLKKYCKYYYGILTQSGEIPETPPCTVEPIKETSVFHYRYAFNYCTFGYTYAFNDWADWERVTDYLILSGYNLVLNPIGNECVWVELLQKFGYTREEAKSYISAPNYLPWQWMMNLSSFQSEYPDSWFDEQKALSQKFNAKLKAFGMSALMPGYCGAVPDDFAQRFPHAKIVLQGKWSGFTRPAILLPDGDLFDRFATEYYRLQRELLASQDMHYYSTDPFHEGGNKGDIDLCTYATQVLANMRKVDERAVWAFQGWQSNPDRSILTALKKEDVVIMNLHADISPDGDDDFKGYPHIYCVINNFGGEQTMRGSAIKTLQLPFAMAKDENSAWAGIGVMPEGVECDEALFDIVGHLAVCGKVLPVKEYIKEYLSARYAKCTDDLVEAYYTLFEKVYNADIVAYPHESGLIARPTRDVTRVCYWAGKATLQDNTFLADVAKTLLLHYDDCAHRQSYKKDLVAVLRQLIANESWRYVYGLNTAFSNRDKAAFAENADKLLALFPLQESIVDCDEGLSLKAYLAKAEKRGKTQAEKAWLIKNAKRLITLWGEEAGCILLHDYAAREYGDMLRYFYKPRWEKYIQTLKHALETGEEFVDYDRYEEEVAFVNGQTQFAENAGNLFDRAQTLLTALGF